MPSHLDPNHPFGNEPEFQTDIFFLSNPLEFISNAHTEMRGICGLIDKIIHNTDLTRAEIEKGLAFLSTGLPLHLQDETEDFFQLLQLRTFPEDDLEEKLEKLEQDHQHILDALPDNVEIIRSRLDGLKHLEAREIATLENFISLIRHHLPLENAIIMPLAKARLNLADLKSLRKKMIERRGYQHNKSEDIRDLLIRNRVWVDEVTDRDPKYFERLADLQNPHYLWLGCSDSRVPANVIAGLEPGEVFVHRNVANIIHSSDLNLLTVLEYAVHVLHIRSVIVCGHYGCGGIHAACEDQVHGLADHWLEPVRRIARKKEAELSTYSEERARHNRLCELNVIDGVRKVAQTPIIRSAWAAQHDIIIHGLIYDIATGKLQNLDCSLHKESNLS